MQVSKEELLHIAKLANIEIKAEEEEEYLIHLQDILNYANVVNKVNLEQMEQTISVSGNENAFRKDEVIEFENKEGLLQNAPEQEDNMFKIPKVIN